MYSPRRYSSVKLCTWLDQLHGVETFVGPAFHFSNLQFLMKRYRLGLDCREQLRIIIGLYL